MIDKEVMEVILKPDLQTRSCTNPIMVNYRSQKFLDLLGPTQYASVTRLSPAFRVRVWLRETSVEDDESMAMPNEFYFSYLYRASDLFVKVILVRTVLPCVPRPHQIFV